MVIEGILWLRKGEILGRSWGLGGAGVMNPGVPLRGLYMKLYCNAT